MVHVLRRPFWLAGSALLAVSTVLQAAALSVGSLSFVQPLLAAELMFTLAVGSLVFHHVPDRRTWLAFVALALGLGLFLGSAAPTEGRPSATPGRWLLAGAAALAMVVVLVLAARLTRGSARAALLALGSAVSFATTAALMKEVTGRIGEVGAGAFAQWPPYALAVAGLTAFVLLQGAFRAGSLTASQPALTLGDALTSVALGWALFDERIGLGLRIVPEVIGVLLIGAGTIGLTYAPSVRDTWDTSRAASGAPRSGGRAPAPRRR
jgi:drug/metabolite transporter (DMT)-like permease